MRRQRTSEVRGRGAERRGGGQKLEIGKQKAKDGKRKIENRNWKLASGKQEAERFLTCGGGRFEMMGMRKAKKG
jgi:hypothetical protein